MKKILISNRILYFSRADTQTERGGMKEFDLKISSEWLGWRRILVYGSWVTVHTTETCSLFFNLMTCQLQGCFSLRKNSSIHPSHWKIIFPAIIKELDSKHMNSSCLFKKKYLLKSWKKQISFLATYKHAANSKNRKVLLLRSNPLLQISSTFLASFKNFINKY